MPHYKQLTYLPYLLTKLKYKSCINDFNYNKKLAKITQLSTHVVIGTTISNVSSSYILVIKLIY